MRGTAGQVDAVVSSTEETYFAPDIGLVRRDSAAIVSNGVVCTPAYSIRARSAVVGLRS